MEPNYTQPTEPLASAPKGQVPKGTNADTGAGVIERYASVDDFRSEFGSYRVNNKNENLCDSSKDYSLQANKTSNDPASLEIPAPEGY